MTKNIMIVGVGGQGSLLASKLLGHLLLTEGYDDKGQADFIVSFEKLEAARYMEYLKKGGRIVVNTQEIDPMPVITGAAVYPENLIEKMEAAGATVDAMDCLTLAEQAGSSKAVNIVLMGRLSKYFDIPVEKWQQAIRECVPPKFVELNLKAFELGRGE